MMSKQKGKSSTMLAVALIAIIVVVGVVVVLRPWEWLNQSQSTVRFYSRTYFYLTNTEDNGPLDNVSIYLPDPHIENEILNRSFIKDGYWILSASTGNGIVVEIQALTVVRLVSPRTSEPVISSHGANTSIAGPKYSFSEIDYLYSGEILEVQLWWELPADMANRLTLRDYGVVAPTYALVYSTPLENISGQFFAGLYRLNNDNTVQTTVEEFTVTFENGPSQYWWGLASV